MTKEEAKKAVDAYMEDRAEEKITLNIEEEAPEITRGELGVTWNNPEIIEEALSIGKSGNLIQRYKQLKDLEIENKVYDIAYTADREMIRNVVAEKCTRYNKEAVDMGLKKTGSGFEIIEGQRGVVVDEEKAVDAVAEFIETEFQADNTQMKIPTKISEPKGNREELAKVKDVLGSFSTSFKTSAQTALKICRQARRTLTERLCTREKLSLSMRRQARLRQQTVTVRRELT